MTDGETLQEKLVFRERWRRGGLPSIHPADRIDCANLVMMGSCFARNLMRWLTYHGQTKEDQPWGVLYNPFSILAEVQRLFEDSNWQEYIVAENDSDGKSILRDPWRTWQVAATRDQLKVSNAEFDRIARGYISRASGVLFSFGLTEVWSPRSNPSVVLNQVPMEAMRAQTDLWYHRFATIDEVRAALSQIVNTVRANVSESCPILFTLSPVPLKYTASRLSIREANNLSKSTILVALHEVCARNHGVTYFPSFEIVQALVERDWAVWQADGRHVTSAVVDLIARVFMDNYHVGELTNSSSKFWVPRVDEYGRVVGKLYVDGTSE